MKTNYCKEHRAYLPEGLECPACVHRDRDRFREALEKIIELNRQHAVDMNGDAKSAERWACVRVARAALGREGVGNEPAP
ncbi:MAG: hypothetical protein H6Q00_1401 [Holophagaceae bacterium]|nr:hypothetical protein [Holophagaceae bacterium]